MISGHEYNIRAHVFKSVTFNYALLGLDVRLLQTEPIIAKADLISSRYDPVLRHLIVSMYL